MSNKLSSVYLFEVDNLLGGEGLNIYDLATLASSDIKWLVPSQDFEAKNIDNIAA